jgi:predicted nucleic acid-binding protein
MNCIIDTSVWIEHLKKPVESLIALLEDGKALTHSWVIGELTLGQFKNRSQFIGNLKLLPQALMVDIDEVLNFIEQQPLYGKGLSLVDVQLLASARLSEAGIFTRDTALLNAMKSLRIHSPS